MYDSVPYWGLCGQAPHDRKPASERYHERKLARRGSAAAEQESCVPQGLTETVNVALACRRAGIPRRTVYDWRAYDADFAQRWDEALDEGIDLLEAEL